MTTPSAAATAWDRDRGRLLGIAYRMLGDFGLAEDVVSEVALEAWQAERSGTVDSWPAWLTTTCVRRSIDRLRHVAARREDYPGPWLPEPVATDRLPDEVAANRELLSITLLHLAEQLTPEARAAIVLHRAFGMTAPEIAPVIDRTPVAVRQLISRGERRLGIDRDGAAPQGGNPAVIERLMRAIESGEVGEVVALLSDDAVLWADGGGRMRSAMNPVFGAHRIARFFAGVIGKRRRADPAMTVEVAPVEVNGEAAISLRLADERDVISLELDSAGRIRGLRRISNPDKLARAL
ncbi:sigma-70 family RNA polymerase sigma factor [Pseudoclavibacter endophyticus]|uniref:Sigma-70 family RNA polymerase sigma factor n=1 Tax=Pseudoclavibacter endophyticus TaxID=1778590 RepID=A0A6H9WQ21_9MICO|nr:sigma-70 family RNA polymerase sigma factor [Pseudoclavibacter endophyticus]KAB1648885.1 sigma-70 family RNA polymerase sigma factor [Pseudoclavibacter endophyticus]